MSTVIYDFHKINDDFYEVDKKIKILRKKINEKMKDDFQNIYAHYLTRLVDGFITDINKNETINEIIEKEIYKDYKDENSSYKLFGMFEQSLLVSVFEKEIYIKLFLDKDYIKLFEEVFENTEEFYYDDRSGEPDDMDIKDWGERARIIDGIFGNKPMMSGGLLADFKPQLFEIEYYFLNNERENIISKVPNKEERIKRLNNHNSNKNKNINDLKEIDKDIFKFIPINED